jgi:Zn-dependent protease with chaperone function
MVHPQIYVTTGIVDRLGVAELVAVVKHEEAHQRARDPIRFALCHAAAEILIFFPLVGWWALQAGRAAELRADRAAMRTAGRAPLARALLTLTEPDISARNPAFSGALTVRVEHLLGMTHGRCRPGLRLVLVSLASSVLFAGSFWCLATVSSTLGTALS